MRIAFVLPSNSITGGIITVLRHARFLRSAGHDVHVGFLRGDDFKPVVLEKLEGIKFCSVERLKQGEPFDAIVGTWWETVEGLYELPAKHYFYFVQGFEDEFYSAGTEEPDRVRQTYQQPLHFISISNAIKMRLQHDFAKESCLVPPGIELADFASCSQAIPSRDKTRVLVEGSPTVEFKRVKETLEILQDFSELEIVYVSPEGRPNFDLRIDYFFQSLKYWQIPSIFKSCTFLLKLSRTESFCMPVLEMFACGRTAIVTAFKGHQEYITHEHNALVVRQELDKKEIRDAVSLLLSDGDLLHDLSRNAEISAKAYPAEASTRMFLHALLEPDGNCAACKRN